jgi:hypothetical protein
LIGKETKKTKGHHPPAALFSCPFLPKLDAAQSGNRKNTKASLYKKTGFCVVKVRQAWMQA